MPGGMHNAAMDFKPLITLLAIVNPLAIVPFIHYTQGFSEAQKRHTVLIASFSAFAGDRGLRAAGPADPGLLRHPLASFQVGGGMLLLSSALSMLNAQPAEARTTQDEVDDANARASIAVVPLTIPLLTGPATMSTVVIYADRAKTLFQHAALIGYGVVIALATAVCFTLAEPIERILGKTGINVSDADHGPDPGGDLGRGDDGRPGQDLPGARCLRPDGRQRFNPRLPPGVFRCGEP